MPNVIVLDLEVNCERDFEDMTVADELDVYVQGMSTLCLSLWWIQIQNPSSTTPKPIARADTRNAVGC